MNKNIYRIISFILVIVWMLVIFMLSAMNGTDSGNESQKVVEKIISETKKDYSEEKVDYIAERANTPFRKCMHVSVYFVLALLLFNFISTFEIKRAWIKYIFSLVIVFLYACTDEYHQTFVTRKRWSVY